MRWSCSAPTSPTASSFPKVSPSSRSTYGGEHRPPGAGRDPAGGHGQGHDLGAAAAAHGQVRCQAPGPADRPLPARPVPAGQARRSAAGQLAAATPVRGGHDRPARRGRRGLHRGRGDAVHLGGTVRADERFAPADRLVQSRVDGQRAAAGRRTGGRAAHGVQSRRRGPGRVRTDRHELSLPPKLTYGEVKGFTLYATRTVLSGEGKELVELAKSNLRDLDIE
jgi:hypothetical protein